MPPQTYSVRAFRDHHLTLWVILALPAAGFVAAWSLAEGKVAMAQQLLHPTGEFSARFLILSMLISPMLAILPGSGFWRWMLNRRRYFGVAAFGYAALHTAFYLIETGALATVLDELVTPAIWTGWLAFFVFLPLAATSTNRAIRRMGKRWKTLQRLVYVAALATLAHWLLLDGGLAAALIHFLPLAALQIWRIRLWLARSATHA